MTCAHASRRPMNGDEGAADRATRSSVAAISGSGRRPPASPSWRSMPGRQLPRGPLGLDAELAIEDRDARLVHAQGTRAVVVEGVQSHEPAVDALVERVEPQPVLAPFDRGPVVPLPAPADRPADRAIAGGEGRAARARRSTQSSYEAGRRSPRYRPAACSSAARSASGSAPSSRAAAAMRADSYDLDVQAKARVRAQRHRRRVGGDEPVRVGPCRAHLVQELAKAVARLCLGRVRPHEEREVTAGRLLVGVQGQVRQQGLCARRRERDGRPVTRDQRERTKEPQLRRRAGRGRRRLVSLQGLCHWRLPRAAA